MKKQTKTILALLLVLTVASGFLVQFGLRAFAKTNGDSGDLKWSLSDDGVFAVSGTGYGANYSLTSYAPWYTLRGDIKCVVVEDGVQALGDYWFYNCSAVQTAELPDTLVKLGANCFRGCSSLQNITVPENCCEYYNYTFYNCTALEWAVLPRDNNTSSYLHKIPDYTFYGCKALENVLVGSGYTGVGANAFRNCSNLKSLVWTGSTLSSVGSNFPSGASFVGAGSIQSWCSSNSKKYIPLQGSCGSSLAYAYDTAARSLTLTGSGAMTQSPWNNWRFFVEQVDFGNASSVSENAFAGCVYLTGDAVLPETVTAVASGAFSGAGYGCYELYGSNVAIADGAFGGSDSLVFYGKRGSGVYDYVCSARDADGSSWRCYCIGTHQYRSDGKCVYCDMQRGATVLEPCGEHRYVYQYRLGSDLYYKCTECERADYCVHARDLLLDFGNALSTADAPYTGNYDGRFDILRDGYVNGRDYKLIRDIKNGLPTDYDRTLTNENATPEAKALFAYINSVYGSQVISGQQESTWVGGPDYEMKYIYQQTGKYPAMRGLDFMGDDFSGCVSRAKAWAKKGGIVTICWHCGSSFNGSFNESQADELTDAQWDAILTDGTAENRAFLQAMDKAGAALQELQAANIPVLWRPFHEFDGAWFWWGKGGSERFKQLWQLMYKHFTYDLGLNNLIWVLGYSHNGTDYGNSPSAWYPGSRYCDIAGADSYEVAQNGGEKRLYSPVLKVTGGAKPLVLHETGLIPTVAQFEEVPWGYFMTWHTTWLTQDNSAEHLREVYQSDKIITLDELPDLY